MVIAPFPHKMQESGRAPSGVMDAQPQQRGMLQQSLDDLSSEMESVQHEITLLENKLEPLLPQNAVEACTENKEAQEIPMSDIMTISRIGTLINNCHILTTAIKRIRETVAT